MAITFVNAGIKGERNGAGNITPGPPAGPQTNDIWIALIHCVNAAGVSMDAAWTEIADFGGTGKMAVYWHRYAGVDPDRLMTIDTNASSAVGAIAAFRGCKTSGSPLNATGTTSTGTDASIEHDSITPTVNGCMLLACNGSHNDNSRTLLTDWFAAFEDDTAGTQNAYVTTLGSDASCSIFYQIQAVAAATGTITVTQSGGIGWGSILLALQPEVSLPIFHRSLRFR